MTRPKLKPVSEEMRKLCFLLGEELLRWPGVSERPMFGMRGFYREDVVFAMLPDKRALRDANAFAYKLADGSETREGQKWKLFGLSSAGEINAALAVLDKAYTKAVQSSSGKR
jgi:hypothetical protein